MKQVRRKKLVAALIPVLGAGMALTATSFDVSAQAQKIEKIEVTGSNIKRIDTETVAPVTIFTREDIARSGAQTISEVIRNVPANNAGSFTENQLNSFAAGAASVSLRGLGPQATLILLNGRRLTNYGFAVGAQTTFVDLNTIPLEVVDRIEVLKDGASAIYGSEAIAGVINIILRKDFRGFEAGGAYSMTSEHDAKSYRATVTAGFGDLAKDKYNAFFNVEHREQDPIKAADRAWTSTGSLVTFASLTRHSANGFPGNYQQRPGTSPGFTGTAPVAGCAPDRLFGNVCRLAEVSSYLTTVPDTKRNSFYGRANLEVNANMSFFAEAGYMKNETFIESTPTFPTSWATLTGLQSISPIVLPVGHPNNPWSAPVNLLYSFEDIGPRTNSLTSEYTRILAGVKGTIGAWDYDSAIGYNKSESTSERGGFLRASVFRRVLADGSYYFGDRSRNSAALYAELSPTVKRTGDTTNKYIDFKTSSELFQMASGPLGFAAGIEYRKEDLADRPDDLVRSGDIIGLGSTAAFGNRNVTSVFGEFSIPILKNLEVQVAGRYDKFSDYGNSSTPKVGFKWTPIKSFAIRGTYSEGFRAPALPEIQDSFAAAFFNNVTDPVRCPVTNAGADCSFSIPGIFGGNPALKAEESKSYTAGFVWEPTQDLSVTLDYYHIKRENEVQTIDLSFLLANESLYPGRVTRGAPVAGDPPGLAGPVTFLNLIYANLARTETSGLDAEFRYKFNLSDVGKVTLQAFGAYQDKYKAAVDVGEPLVNYNGTHNQPRLRGNGAAFLETGPWMFGYGVNYTGRHLYIGTPFQTCPANFAAVDGCVIKPFYTQDVQVKYTGFKNWTIRGSILNVGNARPSLDLNYTELYNLVYSNILGKVYSVAVNYSFK